MTGVVSDFLTLLVLGGHGVVPARLAAARSDASAPDGGYRTWALAALPSLLVAVTGFLAWLRLHPDPLIAVEWGRDPLSTFAGRAVLVLLAALAVADAPLVGTWPRLEPLPRRLLPGFGGTAPLALSLPPEILRVGHGPRTTAAALDAVVGANRAAVEKIIAFLDVQAELARTVVPVQHMNLPRRVAPLDQRSAAAARLERERLGTRRFLGHA